MYFITPEYSVAFNAKAASSTLSRAIIKEFYPERENIIQTAAYPVDKNPDNTQAHGFCPKEKTPSKPVVLVVRDPLTRFCSAMTQLNLTDIDAVLDALEQNNIVGHQRKRKLAVAVHFFRQQPLISMGGTAFRLEDLNEAAEYIGLALPLPRINESTINPLAITTTQEQRILTYYAVDKTLYASLAAGVATKVAPQTTTVVPAPVLPVPTRVTDAQIRLWLVRRGIELSQVSTAISSLSDAMIRAEAEVMWERALYIERNHPLVTVIADLLNMSSEEIDQAFREAVQI